MNNYEEQLKEQLKIIDKDNRSLQQENIYLREKCKELQIILKEVKEYIEKHWGSYYWTMSDSKIELLEILDKGKE